jgi:hypothetical protein
MNYELKCSECGEILGHLSKDEITEDDRTFYREGMQCSSAHELTIEIIEIVEAPADTP